MGFHIFFVTYDLCRIFRPSIMVVIDELINFHDPNFPQNEMV